MKYNASKTKVEIIKGNKISGNENDTKSVTLTQILKKEKKFTNNKYITVNSSYSKGFSNYIDQTYLQPSMSNQITNNRNKNVKHDIFQYFRPVINLILSIKQQKPTVLLIIAERRMKI